MPDRKDAGARPAGYASYLLRLWRFDRGGEVAWRISSTRTDSGEEVVFARLEALLDYLTGEESDCCD